MNAGLRLSRAANDLKVLSSCCGQLRCHRGDHHAARTRADSFGPMRNRPKSLRIRDVLHQIFDFAAKERAQPIEDVGPGAVAALVEDF